MNENRGVPMGWREREWARRRAACGVALAGLAAWQAGPAQAQDGSGAVLEEIIVTAQKRQERLADTPLSISAVTAETLERLGATQFRDFAQTVPGLNFTTSGAGDTQVNLRGVTTGANVSPTVAIYVDDVPYGSSTAFANSASLALDVGLFDLERVEVLRGPQGTLYGASSMGGLVKYVTRRPELDAMGGTAQLGLSTTRNGGTGHTGNAALNVPLAGGKVAARAGGFHTRDAGYVDDPAAGRRNLNRADIGGGRLDLLAAPSEGLEVRLTAFAQDIERDGNAAVDKDRLTGRPIGGALEQRRLRREGFDQEFRLVSGAVEYDAGPVLLSSITSYQTVRSDGVTDLSALYVPLLAGFGLNYAAVDLPKSNKTDKFVQEVRVASPGGGAVDWLLGGFYTHEDSRQRQRVDPYGASGALAAPVLLAVDLPSTYEEAAGFANATWHVTDRLDLGAGLRYAANDQGYEQVATGILAGSFPEATSEDEVVTYVGNAQYRFTDRAMAYARVASGYRPGGPNFVANDPATGQPLAPPTFKADKLWSYEGGLRAETGDRRYSLDASAYWIDWDDMQVAAVRNALGVLANAGSARVRGVEATLSARPTAALRLGATLAYADAELREDAPDLGGDKGHRLPNTPRFAATVLADYDFELGGHEASAGITFRHVSARVASFDQSAGSPQYRLPDYQTVDLRLGVELGPVEARLAVRNLFDKRGELSAITAFAVAGGPARVTVLQPRTIGLTLGTRF